MYAISQNIEYERKIHKIDYEINGLMNGVPRYCGVGLSFAKYIIYQAGARPVIYEKRETINALFEGKENELWRAVVYDFDKYEYGNPSNMDITDWTHEREWRIPNKYNFDDCTGIHIILYNPDCYRHFMNNCPDKILCEISGITTLTSLNI